MTPTLLDPPRRPDSSVSPRPPRGWWGWALLAVLAGALVFAHWGCHGDHDDEPGAAAPERRER